jgi:hypothetical protein
MKNGRMPALMQTKLEAVRGNQIKNIGGALGSPDQQDRETYRDSDCATPRSSKRRRLRGTGHSFDPPERRRVSRTGSVVESWASPTQLFMRAPLPT